jgi:hypothetical protein
MFCLFCCQPVRSKKIPKGHHGKGAKANPA